MALDGFHLLLGSLHLGGDLADHLLAEADLALAEDIQDLVLGEPCVRIKPVEQGLDARPFALGRAHALFEMPPPLLDRGTVRPRLNPAEQARVEPPVGRHTHRSEGRGECGELLAFALGASRGGCARRKADGRGGHTAAVARPLARLEAADALVRLLERLAYGTAEPGAEAARLHALEQLLGPPHDLFALALRRKDRELVAADPEDALVGAQYLSRGLAHGSRRLLDLGVAGVHAEMVVDRLEVLEVDQNMFDVRVSIRRSPSGVVCPLVRESRERVDIRGPSKRATLQSPATTADEVASEPAGRERAEHSRRHLGTIGLAFSGHETSAGARGAKSHRAGAAPSLGERRVDGALQL